MSRGSPVVTRRRSLPTMDISEILENKASTSNSRSIAIDNDQITVDAGLLTVFDTTELDAELYKYAYFEKKVADSWHKFKI